MHLESTHSTYKGTTYTSYRLARSVRNGSTVRKEVLFPLGPLTPLQAQQIHLILRTLKKPSEVLVALDQVIPTKTVAYLDLAVANALWDEWALDSSFAQTTASPLPTPAIARILTLNRCIAPCSHYAVPKWVARTALPEILGLPLDKLTDDKIYYELALIEQNKPQLEHHLSTETHRRSPASYQFVNYDLSSSYFVGIRCTLSRFGKSKDHEPYQRQVVLALLVNAQGYPFKWDVFPGNQAEVKTLEANVRACKKLGVPAVTLVFDRGLVSQKNLQMVGREELKYISALDRPQIPQVPGIDLPALGRLREKDTEAQLQAWARFTAFSDKVFFQDLGVVAGRRHVLSLNTHLLREERQLRRQKLRQWGRSLKALNADLRAAQRDRDGAATKKRVTDELKRLKLTRFFHEPQLIPLGVSRPLKNGPPKQVASFQLRVAPNPAALKAAKLLDGVGVFISNHVEKQDQAYTLPPHQILQAYRDKTEIEDAFKNMKSVLKLRPFFVNTATHVRAVFTLCVLAYLLNKTLANRRKQLEGKDYLNSRELYAPFTEAKLVTLTDPNTDTTIPKLVPPPPAVTTLLNQLGLAHLLDFPPQRPM